MRVGKFRKAPADRKRYVVNYADWLNEGELITAILMTGSVPGDSFYVDGYLIDTGAKQIIFYVSGGIAGTEYNVTSTVTTSLQQIKEDYVTFVVT